MDKKCRELLGKLGGPLDGEAGGVLCRRLEAHLARCPRCRVVLDTTRRTVRLFRDDQEPCLPPRFERHLHGLLKACWESRTPRPA